MPELTIEDLRRALVPSVAPPEERVAAFRAFVLEAPVVPPPPPPTGPRWLAWLKDNWLLIIAALVAAIIAALTISYLLNVNPPAGLNKTAAHELGLPVDSAHLEDARDTARELRAALAAGNQEEARTLAAQLAGQLDGLDGDERAKISDADELIAQATNQPAPGTATATPQGP